MLYILFSIILLIPTLMGFGRLVEYIHTNSSKTVFSQLIAGTVLLTLLWTIVAFFFPLNILVEAGTIVVGISLFFITKVYRQLTDFCEKHWSILTLATAFILFFTSFFPFILDHFGYYVPTVKWISEVGLVEGISNVDLLLGQTSLWHIFQSGFSHFTDSSLRINALVGVIFLIYTIERKQWLLLTLLPFAYLFLQSPSPDLPAAFFSLILVSEILKGNTNIKNLFILSIFIFGIKPTFLWASILVFLYAVFTIRKDWRQLIPGTVLLVLVFFKNIWVFGYPVFPIAFPDLGIGWAPNSTLMKQSSQMAILKTYDLQYSIAEIQQFSFWQYIKNWLFLPGLKGIINTGFIISLITLGIFSWLKKQRVYTLLFVAILIKSILVLIFSAQYRFFLEVFLVIFFVIFRAGGTKRISMWIFTVFSVFAMAMFCFPKLLQQAVPSFRVGAFMAAFQKEQLLSPAEYDYKQYTLHQIGNLKFNLVKDYPFMFQTPLPAISPSFLKSYLDAGIFPQQSGANYHNGFHWRKLNTHERAELQSILKSWEQDFKKQ